MADWSIKIVPGSDEAAEFVPDLKGYQAGDPLPAQQDDLVSWNNTTNKTHQITAVPPTNSPTGYLEFTTDPIPAGESSRPSYDVAPGTVNYFCKLHDNEKGTIIATVPPSS
ncbi:MAG: cupredoxin domain-containing protein [Blastocatellia bacterium]